MPDPGIYRNADDSARARRDQAIARWTAEAAEMGPWAPATYARRVARAWAGRVALLGFAATAAASVAGRDGHQTYVLLIAWAAAIMVYLTASAAAWDRMQRALRRTATPTRDPWADLERLEAETPQHLVKRWAAAIERDSTGWYMVGLTLLLPLTIHLVASLVLETGQFRVRDFNIWISLSMAGVGHCHIVAAWRAWKFGETLGEKDGWKALGWALVWSLGSGLPFLFVFDARLEIAFVLPIPVAIIVMLTGLYLPITFGRMRKRIEAERAVLG